MLRQHAHSLATTAFPNACAHFTTSGYKEGGPHISVLDGFTQISSWNVPVGYRLDDCGEQWMGEVEFRISTGRANAGEVKSMFLVQVTTVDDCIHTTFHSALRIDIYCVSTPLGTSPA